MGVCFGLHLADAVKDLVTVDRRACVRDFIQACRHAASDLGLGVPEPEAAGNG